MRNFGDSVIGGLCAAVLQVLWACRLFYEGLVAGLFNAKSTDDANGDKLEDISQKRDYSMGNTEKRHLIRFFSTPDMVGNNRDRPIYYMHVSEIMSPIEEEMLRHACAKGHPGTYMAHSENDLKRRTFPPTGVWMDFTTTFTG